MPAGYPKSHARASLPDCKNPNKKKGCLRDRRQRPVVPFVESCRSACRRCAASEAARLLRRAAQVSCTRPG